MRAWRLLAALPLLVLASCVTSPQREDYSLDTLIMGRDEVDRERFVSYVQSRNQEIARDTLRRVHRAYEGACRAEGVRMSVALAQMLHETNFLKFTGTVKPEQNNFAGLGTINASTPGEYFPDIETGALAHVQHLKAYASHAPLVMPLKDPRFKYVKRGTAPHLGGLTGRWAADPAYGERLVSHIRRLMA